MQQIISNPPSRLQQREINPVLPNRLPLVGLVLLVSIPAAILTAIIMGFVNAIRFVTRFF